MCVRIIFVAFKIYYRIFVNVTVLASEQRVVRFSCFLLGPEMLRIPGKICHWGSWSGICDG